MPKYQVEYTTDSEPVKPSATTTSNFKATKLSLLGEKILNRHTFGLKFIRVVGTGCGVGSAVIEIPNGEDICLDRKNVDTLIGALQEARGTAAPAKASVDVKPFDKTVGMYADVRVRVDQSALDDRSAYFHVSRDGKSVSEWMDRESTRELYETLKTIVGE